MPFEIIPVWNKVTPVLEAELSQFWLDTKALLQEKRAAARAKQVVCIARSEQGDIVGLGSAYPCIVPLLRQPMYYYRTYVAPDYRGKGLMIPLLNASKEALQEYNLAALPKLKCLGVIVETENKQLEAAFHTAYWPRTGFTFMGYSKHGLPLRVWYFKGARVGKPYPLKPAAAATAS